MNETFDIEVTRTYTFRRGWGVMVTPVWAGEEEPNRVAEIDVDVAEIAPELVRVIGNAPCVHISGQMYCPIENFEELDEPTVDDSHDLRSRWFPTEAAARDHAEWTRGRWDNPSPWESFVVVA